MAVKEWNRDTACDQIGDFLDDLLDASGLDIDYEIADANLDHDLITPDLIVSFTGPDLEMLLAHRGEALLALEHLTLEALHSAHEDRHRVIFDANDFRMARIDELRMFAETAAEKVRSSGRPFHFQPMTSRERRILHLALRDEEGVKSESEGVVPRRHTVVLPE